MAPNGIGGVSTRCVDELTQAMGLYGISRSTVSEPCKDIDERVNEFLNQPLTRCPAAIAGNCREGTNGPVSGWMPPVSSCARAGGLSASPP